MVVKTVINILLTMLTTETLKGETGRTSLIMLNLSLFVPVGCATVVRVFSIMERLWEDDGDHAESAFQAELRVKLIFRRKYETVQE